MGPPAWRPPPLGQGGRRPTEQGPLRRQEFAEPRPKTPQALPRLRDLPATTSNPLLGDPNPADRDIIL
eukprot:14104205-Heterocapsa_arctica.AAC.1